MSIQDPRELLVLELRDIADTIETRADFVRSLGGTANAYGAIEIIRTRADEIEAQE